MFAFLLFYTPWLKGCRQCLPECPIFVFCFLRNSYSPPAFAYGSWGRFRSFRGRSCPWTSFLGATPWWHPWAWTSARRLSGWERNRGLYFCWVLPKWVSCYLNAVPFVLEALDVNVCVCEVLVLVLVSDRLDFGTLVIGNNNGVFDHADYEVFDSLFVALREFVVVEFALVDLVEIEPLHGLQLFV